MTIDTIIGAPRPTPAEISAALGMTAAVAEAIRAAGEIPEGTLYAMLVGKVTIGGFQRMIGVLRGAGLISVTNHLCRWTGPTLAPAQEEDELERARRRAPMQEGR
jgi:hypothetical protein